MRWPRCSAIALAALLVAGCAEQDPPGVDALVLQTDLAFGIAEQDEPATPPPNVLAPLVPVGEEGTQIIASPPSLPPTEPVPECRAAGLTDFPEEPAARTVDDDRRPAIGTSRWVREGEVRDSRTGNVPISVDGYEQRAVTAVTELDDGVFEYLTEQQDLTTGATVSRTWRVRPASTSASPSDAIITPTIPGLPSPQTRVGEPDRGLSLVRQVTTTTDGVEQVFEPSSPLLVFPLPARPGETFSSSAVDPATFQSMSFSNATVGVAERVDACGDVVEGWPVEGAFQFVGPDGETVTFTYRAVVVPQHGAVLAAETITQGVEGGPGIDVAWRLGQLEPDAPEDDS